MMFAAHKANHPLCWEHVLEYSGTPLFLLLHLTAGWYADLTENKPDFV
jgi:hypothetical protein